MCAANPMNRDRSFTGTGRHVVIATSGSANGATTPSSVSAPGTRSALQTTSTRSRACARKQLIADAFPSRVACTMSRTRGSRSAQQRTMSSVPSSEPLETTTISVTVAARVRCETTASRSRPMLAASLWAMTPTEHAIEPGPPPVVIGRFPRRAALEAAKAAALRPKPSA